ncbi:bifunctional oligoribonuclease/PAP phosphatase NrnA [bacterium]|nr:bifunctional oligoribonuclease/PAP phosphatase NrnA [bacterium]
MFSTDPLARMYKFLPHADKVVCTRRLPEGVPDVVLVADNANFRRLGKEYVQQLNERGIGPGAERKSPNCTLINIDHHVDNERYGDINLVDPACGACGELFYDWISALGVQISLDTAINIYAAILTDTGRFSYGNTSQASFRIASELINIGVDPHDVVNRIYNTSTPIQIKLLMQVMGTLTVVDDLGYFYCYVSQGMLRELDCILTDTEPVLDLMKTVAGFDVCFFFKEEKDGRVKVSARSNGQMNVNKFAQRFGGGGHPAASGFRLDTALDDSPDLLAGEMRKYREEQAKSGSPVKEPVAE